MQNSKSPVCKRELGNLNTMIRKSPEDPNLYCFEAYPCQKCSRCVMCNINSVCSGCNISKENKLKADRRKVSVDLRRINRQDSKEFYVDNVNGKNRIIPKRITKSLDSIESQGNQENNKKEEESKEKRRSKSLEKLNEEEAD